MLLQIVSLLISSLSLFQNGATNKDAQPNSYEDAEAYEVYSVILPTVWPSLLGNAKSLVIRSETIGYKMCLQPEAESEKIIGQAISEYVKLNKMAWLLQRRLSIEKPYELIPYDELRSALKQGGWENFYKQYPNSGGWIELSAIGFNADKTVAVVYMGRHSWSLSGGGRFHVLQKKDGKWTPLKLKWPRCAWES
ncbi:MAG TPA: hypothetical protein VFV58_14995 [Blastocatellia bacterium]|jgi:hypothetical protein|nr:hypothetical protein [Blastocatellia bacterium]